jgi:SAM-dependent methyltransferase
MARHVRKGWVIGIDACMDILPKPYRSNSFGEEAYLGFTAAHAHRLPFVAEAFDVTCTHTLLMHLPDAERALHELIRVTRIGGAVIALGEGDWLPVRSDPVCLALDRVIEKLIFGIKRQGGNPYLGRTLEALFRRVGLIDVQMKQLNQEGASLTGHELLKSGYLEIVRPILEKSMKGGAHLGNTMNGILDDIHHWCRKPGSVLILPRSFSCRGHRAEES